jgi:hypothetical protein
VLRFIGTLLVAVVSAKGAAGAMELVELLDTQAWGQGRALKDLVPIQELSSRVLAEVFKSPVRSHVGARSDLATRRSNLQLWRPAAVSAIGLWPGGEASVPERLRGLVGTAAAWLRLAEGSSEAGHLLETVVSVPRIGPLLAPPKASQSTPFPWAWILRLYAKGLQASRSNELMEASEKTVQSLDREYMLVYLSGNLWELHHHMVYHLNHY